ncbi:MAG: DUF1295 domain-containing protein [Verrucomicrobiota bacterium]|nr:DUF1295 domain-containing protein [Verrucomicrobiota bacterium]MEC8405519.1 DUF1295 domain-containing protein [Verrucomicrobiota bacterium]MEC8650344.1 DUF1295 domain-containing protein [Verrucomicrobiota bacterium]
MSSYWIAFFLIGFIAASLTYSVALRLGTMAVVDLVWSVGMGFAAIAYLINYDLYHVRAFLVVGVLFLWSSRLSYYLLKNRVISGHEDPRYAYLATYWGPASRRNFLGLFLVQILFVALFLLPVTVAMRNTQSLNWLDTLALIIAVIALTGETIADRQLAAFRKSAIHSNKVCQNGLWRYSRHPNYFFEWVHWWAYVAFAWNCTISWLTWIGPVAMYLFLRYLTGIPHAERSSLITRGDAYRQYQQTTSAFFLWFPRIPKN